jgi:hypothetical protein
MDAYLLYKNKSLFRTLIYQTFLKQVDTYINVISAKEIIVA